MRATEHFFFRLLPSLLLALAASAPLAAGVGGSEPTPEVSTRAGETTPAANEEALLAQRRAARLTRLEERAAAGEVSRMAGAVPVLLDLAAEPGAPGEERRRAVDLLTRIAAGGAPAAERAERALETLDEISARAGRPATAQGTEGVGQETMLRGRLDLLMERVADPRRADRGRLASTLVLLASAVPADEPTVGRFGEWMKRDPDPEVVRWGEVLAARFDGRPPAPELVPSPRPGKAKLRRERERREQLLEQAVDADSRRRYDALSALIELAVGRGQERDPEVLALLRAALDDPDSRVRGLARFSLRGLAGERQALGMVYTAEPIE